MILGFLVVSSVLVVSLGRLGDHVRSRADVQPRLRRLHGGVAVADDRLDARAGRRGLAHLVPDRAGSRRRLPRRRTRWRSSPTRSPPTSVGSRSVSTTSSASAACSSVSCSAACSRRSRGGSSSLCPCLPGSSGTIWSYRSLRELGVRTREPVDWAGNLTFGAGLVLVMVGITYGIRPYGNHPMGWTSPVVNGVPRRRRGPARAVRRGRAALEGADVPAAAVPDPRVHLRRPLELPLGDLARRSDVHADHLAAGHLATPARRAASPRLRSGPGSGCCR